jgi:hypothetical protein
MAEASPAPTIHELGKPLRGIVGAILAVALALAGALALKSAPLGASPCGCPGKVNAPLKLVHPQYPGLVDAYWTAAKAAPT